MPARSEITSVEDYLSAEEHAVVRSEYVDGKIYAMTGGTDTHERICGNLFSILYNHFRGSGCRAYINGMKVRIDSANCFYYPDVIVSCEGFQPGAAFKTAPSIIVEVLSPSTSHVDMREKLIAYKLLGTLSEYMIVHQAQQRIELHRRVNEESWSARILNPSEEIVLGASTGRPTTVSFAEIYYETEVPEPLSE